MGKFYRLGGDDRIEPFTNWEKNMENYCIYCGEQAYTRDHVPSRVFLSITESQELDTIPACFVCNNGFSKDEAYVASFIYIVRKIIDPDFSNERINKLLYKEKELVVFVENQIKNSKGGINLSYSEQSFINVLIKLAKGHLGIEFDYVNFDSQPILNYHWIFDLKQSEIDIFYHIPEMEILPEVGSRSFNRLGCSDIEENKYFLSWIEVQEGIYRYLVYFNKNQNPCVKISICEVLLCSLQF